MIRTISGAAAIGLLVVGSTICLPKTDLRQRRGFAKAEDSRPGAFPQRIWAACDFEGKNPDYAWFGPAEKKNIPRYPGNTTALGVSERPYKDFSGLMTGINPVPGPRIGKENKLYLRYFLRGASEATFQFFSLTREDNNHIRVSRLRQNRWSETTLDFTRDALRNDGSAESFAEGERMDDFKVFAGKPAQAQKVNLLLDDVIFFSDEPVHAESEPFPNRVIYLAAFDTGPKEKYWPGNFEIVDRNLPPDSYWKVARAILKKVGKEKWISLQIAPPRPVGTATKLRFRYYLTGTSRLTVQIFDATDQDNRHIHLNELKQGAWTTITLDFTRDSKRNDGGKTPFSAGHLVDDIFFFLKPESDIEPNLLIDEVVLFDAGH